MNSVLNILFKSYEMGSIIVLFLHMRNERYERLVNTAQGPRDSQWISNLYPVSAVLLLLRDLVNKR